MSEAAKSLVNAFISNRLDYCNSLLYGITDPQLQSLQSVQNAAARLVTGTRRSEHIVPVFRSLYWLPVCQCITFKVATIVHKCLNGHAPAYLSNDLQYAGQHRIGMRSASVALLEVPRSRTAIGDWSFSITGPRVWTLCLLLFVTWTRLCASGNSWKRFSLSDGHGAGGVELAPLNTLTHLLT